MTGLLPGRRRAERFADLVEAGATPSTATSGDFAPLLRIVGSLDTLAEFEIAPRPAFAADLRERLMAEAETALNPADAKLTIARVATPATRRNRRATAAAVGLLLAGSSAGVAAASQGALPGDTFYPLKRGLEQADSTWLTFGDRAEGGASLHMADARLSEVSGLLERESVEPQNVNQALTSFTASAAEGADTLFGEYRSSSDPESVITVREFAGSAMRELSAAASAAPSSSMADFAVAAQTIVDIDQQALRLCADCGPREPLQVPTDLVEAMPAGLDGLLTEPVTTPAPSQVPGNASGAGVAATAGVPAPPAAGSDGSASGSQGSGSGDLGLGGLIGSTPSTGAGGTSGSDAGSENPGSGNPGSGSGNNDGGNSSGGNSGNGAPSTDPGSIGSVLPSVLPTALPGVGDAVGGLGSGLGDLTDPGLKP